MADLPKHWKWMRGMSFGGGRFLVGADAVLDSDTPDYDHPATKGCMLARVREVFGDPRLTVGHVPGGWAIIPGNSNPPSAACRPQPSESDALRVALEVGPRQGGEEA
jgi:hypothetical protein